MSDWQKHVLAATGYRELGMFEEAARALEEVQPEDKARREVLGAQVDLYMASKKWDMAAALAGQLLKVEPENVSWWINLAYATRRSEGVEKAEIILLKASELYHDNALIEFNLACYASALGRLDDAKDRLQRAIQLKEDLRPVALADEDLKQLRDWIVGLP